MKLPIAHNRLASMFPINLTRRLHKSCCGPTGCRRTLSARLFWVGLRLAWPDWKSALVSYDPRRLSLATAAASHGTGPDNNEAFPDDANARFLLHDRDTTFDAAFDRAVEAFGLAAVRTAPRSPWQNPYVERVIGSIRRECLDHVIVFNERHLRRVLRTYVAYYQRSRTQLALGKDASVGRAVQPTGASWADPKSAVCTTATTASR